MNIQIFGFKNCSETKKAQRYFKERNIPFQFINMQEKKMSRGELESISAALPAESLIDRESKEYKKQNLQYMSFSIEEKLMENPSLFKTPIVRNKKKATSGYVPDTWKIWMDESK